MLKWGMEVGVLDELCSFWRGLLPKWGGIFSEGMRLCYQFFLKAWEFDNILKNICFKKKNFLKKIFSPSTKVLWMSMKSLHIFIATRLWRHQLLPLLKRAMLNYKLVAINKRFPTAEEFIKVLKTNVNKIRESN